MICPVHGWRMEVKLIENVGICQCSVCGRGFQIEQPKIQDVMYFRARVSNLM